MLALLVSALPLSPLSVQAEDESWIAATNEFAAALAFSEGQVELASGEVSFDLPEGWAFLQARDARLVVEDFWGNPPDTSTIGFIDPPHELGRLQSDYGIIVSMENDGYVEDDDAADIDWEEMMDDMMSDSEAANRDRAEAGYETVDLLGWAEPPHYDAADHKIFWAKKIRFGDSPDLTLNYDVRVLGRRGALVLQAVAPMEAFAEVQAGMQVALASTSFQEGHRYQDFDSGIDKVAAYGIGGLVAGKLAAKAGLFAILAKSGKLILLAVVGAFVAAKKFLFGGDKGAEAEA